MKGFLFFITIIMFCNKILPQTFWQQTNGPSGGDIRVIAVNSKNHVFAGVHKYGIYRSMDDGKSWEKINPLLTDLEINSIAIDSSDYIYAGVGDQGIFRSMNNGDNWIQLNQLTHLTVSHLLINSMGFIFAGTDSGLYRSMDNGENWHKFNLDTISRLIPNVEFLTITGDDQIFIRFTNENFRSSDNGWTWTRVDIPSRLYSVILDSDSNLIASCSSAAIYKSIDSGVTWEELSSIGTHSYFNQMIMNSEGFIFGGCMLEGIFRSIDKGESWTQINNGLTGWSFDALTVNTNGSIFAGSSSGLFKSDDNGNSWTESDSGIINTNIDALLIDSKNDIYASNIKGIYKSTDNGERWINVSSDIDYLFYYFPSLSIDNSGNIFAGDANIGAFRSADNGNSWKQIEDLADVWVTDFAFKSNGYAFAGTNGNGLYRSTDNGENWTRFNDGMILTYDGIYSLEIQSNSDVLAGTYNGIYVTSDNGDHWTPLDDDFNERVGDVAVNPENTYIFAACGNDGLYRFNNDGMNREKLSNGLEDASVNLLCICSDGHIYAGTFNRGIFHSTDNGESWVPLNEGLSVVDIRDIKVSPNGYLFVGTYGEGVLRSINPVVSLNGNTITPSVFLLEQNYPNPFNPVTTINYTISKMSFVTIKVYNLLGEEVSILVNEQKTAGSHEIEFDGGNLASGIYIYKMQAGSFSDAKKLILLK